MRYRLRTLMIVLALGPPVTAVAWVHYKPLAILAIISTAFVAQSAVIYSAVTFTLHALKPRFDAMNKQDNESAAPRDRPT